MKYKEVTYNNVIGFLIGLGSFKLMIRQILDNPDGDEIFKQKVNIRSYV